MSPLLKVEKKSTAAILLTPVAASCFLLCDSLPKSRCTTYLKRFP